MFLSWLLGPLQPRPKSTVFLGGGKKNAGVLSGPGLPLILTFSPAAKNAAKAKGKDLRRNSAEEIRLRGKNGCKFFSSP
jgi:hypothetical protein